MYLQSCTESGGSVDGCSKTIDNPGLPKVDPK